MAYRKSKRTYVTNFKYVLHARAWLRTHAKIILVQKCLKKKNFWSGHLCCAKQEHTAGGCAFWKVCLEFVESMARAEHLHNAMATPSWLLHMNKLLLSVEHCLLHVHIALWKASFLIRLSKKHECRKTFLCASCNLPPACRSCNRPAR